MSVNLMRQSPYTVWSLDSSLIADAVVTATLGVSWFTWDINSIHIVKPSLNKNNGMWSILKSNKSLDSNIPQFFEVYNFCLQNLTFHSAAIFLIKLWY